LRFSNNFFASESEQDSVIFVAYEMSITAFYNSQNFADDELYMNYGSNESSVHGHNHDIDFFKR